QAILIAVDYLFQKRLSLCIIAPEKVNLGCQSLGGPFRGSPNVSPRIGRSKGKAVFGFCQISKYWLIDLFFRRPRQRLRRGGTDRHEWNTSPSAHQLKIAQCSEEICFS